MRLLPGVALVSALLATGCQPPTPAYRCSTRADCPAGWECNTFYRYCYRGATGEGGVADAGREGGAGDAVPRDRSTVVDDASSVDHAIGTDTPTTADGRPPDTATVADATTRCDPAECTAASDPCVLTADCVADQCVKLLNVDCNVCEPAIGGSCVDTASCTTMACADVACEACPAGCNCVTTCDRTDSTTFARPCTISGDSCPANSTCTLHAVYSQGLVFNCAAGSDCALICDDVHASGMFASGCTMWCKPGAHCLLECHNSDPCQINTAMGMPPTPCDASVCGDNKLACNRECPATW